VFYTSRDFHGRLNDAMAGRITAVVRERFGVASTLATCTQVHGATARRVKREDRWRECDSCDALLTAERGVALGIKVADCLPVTLVDPRHGVLANIHSGWRGAVQNITGVTLDALERDTAFEAASALAYLGPTIRACCFEVGDEVAVQFDPQYVDRSRPKAHVDVPALTAGLLRNRGFSEIHDSGLCTRCEGSIFHSFRRDGSGGGRNLAIAAQ
jgi:YfiH family protein